MTRPVPDPPVPDPPVPDPPVPGPPVPDPRVAARRVRRRADLLTGLPAVGLLLGGLAVLDPAGPAPRLAGAAQAQVQTPVQTPVQTQTLAQAAGESARRAAGAAGPCAPAAPRTPTKPGAAAPASPGPATPAPANPCRAAAVTTAAANPFDVTRDWVQAPYGDRMPDLVRNYLRAAPYVGTGGVVAEDAYGELKRLGFKTILSLNTVREGAEAEAAAARAAGLAYVFLPVATPAPTPEQIDRFAEVVNDPATYPILVHCQSANRVGAAWALYRAANGVPPEIAIQEGRTVGLRPSREAAVRARLGLPALRSE